MIGSCCSSCSFRSFRAFFAFAISRFACAVKPLNFTMSFPFKSVTLTEKPMVQVSLCSRKATVTGLSKSMWEVRLLRLKTLEGTGPKVVLKSSSVAITLYCEGGCLTPVGLRLNSAAGRWSNKLVNSSCVQGNSTCMRKMKDVKTLKRLKNEGDATYIKPISDILE